MSVLSSNRNARYFLPYGYGSAWRLGGGAQIPDWNCFRALPFLTKLQWLVASSPSSLFFARVRVCVRMCVCVCACMCLGVCVHVCVCLGARAFKWSALLKNNLLPSDKRKYLPCCISSQRLEFPGAESCRLARLGHKVLCSSQTHCSIVVCSINFRRIIIYVIQWSQSIYLAIVSRQGTPKPTQTYPIYLNYFTLICH